MRCRNCDTINPENYRHCSNCGTGLAGCEVCGFENLPGARFCGGCGRPIGGPPEVQQRSISAERRFTTILFCDLIGSTALSTTLDPEELRSIIISYHDMFRKVVEEHDGFVAQYLGDGILAYFGYPSAREDDAERAVRAGLELVDEVASSDSGYEIRVGIASGMVVVGDLTANNFFDREPAVGSTPNLAARLQEVAQGGCVVVCPTTRNLVGGQFKFEDLGSHDLKGFGEPVPLSHAVAEHTGINRFEASRVNHQLANLVGRDQELEKIIQSWELMKVGNGQVVCLRGEPGLGKSRLTLAVTAVLANEQYISLSYQCGPHFSNTALYPFISQIERSAEFARGDSADEKLDKLEALLARTGSDDFGGSVRYIAALTSILFAERYAPIEESAERQKERTLDMLLLQIQALAARQPLLVLFEDVHWIDPTSLELLIKIVEMIDKLPVLLLVTCRPEFTPPWQELAHSTIIDLVRLGDRESMKIIDDISAPATLPNAVKQGILARSEGNPLYIEELTSSVVESDSSGGKLNRSVVPESLQTSLNERLDRHSSNKNVAQVAAVLGREFTLDLLTATTQTPTAELGIILERLIDADIVQRTSDLIEPTYRFKHALLQDAAYESILLIERAKIHRRVAHALETEFPEILEKQPEAIARHLSEAGEAQRAINYWVKAGERAAGRAAHADAVDHLSKALALLEKIPESIERHHLELKLLGAYGFSLSASQGYAAPEVEAAQLRALELCELIGDEESLYAVKRRLGTFFIVRGELDRAGELAHQCIELGESRDRPDYLIEGYNALGYVLGYQGQYDDAMKALEHAALLYQTKGGQNFSYPTEQNPLLAVLAMMGLISSVRGELKQALKHIDEAVALGKKLGRPFDQAYVENFCSSINHIQGLTEEGQSHGRASARLSDEHGFGLWLCLGKVYATFSNSAEEPSQDRIDLINENVTLYQLSGARLFGPFLQGCVARTYLTKGLHNEANAALQQGFQQVERFNERLYEPALHRIQGELQVSMGLIGNARECFSKAIDLSRQMGATLFELQALIALVKLERKSGDSNEGTQTSLAGLVEEFVSRGEVSPDLDEARRLLAANE